ncbi:hypothetical protein [Caldisphaera sp.]|uniref:hypothetical protein n=1 Tax=Caldisphaera sp. TaxID=2060322 RepID=UPI003D134200
MSRDGKELYKSGRNNRGDFGEKEEIRSSENGIRRDLKGYKPNGSSEEYNNRVYNDSCKELLRRLAEVSSEEASLVFRIYKLREDAKYMTLELSGLLSQYRMLGGDYNEFKKFFEDMFEKYVK